MRDAGDESNDTVEDQRNTNPMNEFIGGVLVAFSVFAKPLIGSFHAKKVLNPSIISEQHPINCLLGWER